MTKARCALAAQPLRPCLRQLASSPKLALVLFGMYWRLSTTPISCLYRVARSEIAVGSCRRQLRSLSAAPAFPASPISVQLLCSRHRSSTLHHANIPSRKCQRACTWSRDLAYRKQPRTSICRQICHTTALLDVEPQQQHDEPQTARHTKLTMDYTALVVSIQELKTRWIPAKVEQVTQLSKEPLALHFHAGVVVYECYGLNRRCKVTSKHCA